MILLDTNWRVNSFHAKCVGGRNLAASAWVAGRNGAGSGRLGPFGRVVRESSRDLHYYRRRVAPFDSIVLRKNAETVWFPLFASWDN